MGFSETLSFAGRYTDHYWDFSPSYVSAGQYLALPHQPLFQDKEEGRSGVGDCMDSAQRALRLRLQESDGHGPA
jgi:hypothetical protein